LPVKLTFVRIELLLKLYIPPPLSAWLPVKATFARVGLLLSLYIPPPELNPVPSAFPAVTVNPSRIALLSVPPPVTTW